MLLIEDLKSFFDNVYTYYTVLPDEGRLIIYIIFILILIATILFIIMLQQQKLNKRIISTKPPVSENTEVLDFDFTDIDENNEKTRNLKEITDKIQAVIDNRAVDLTKFEQDQEENSIISYDELMEKVGKPVDEVPNQDFSLPDLVHKIEVDDEIEKEAPYVSPGKEEKFKSSVFISPVFGIQDQNRTIIKEELKPANKTEKILPTEDLNEEETFLTNLINFRKNLD